MEEVASSRWDRTSPHVKKALHFIRSKGSVTTEQLVEWDARHGKLLFDWTDEVAGPKWREHQARLFFGYFTTFIKGFRVRPFINLREDEAAGIEERGYFTAEAIADSPKLRAMVIEDLMGRMANLAKELKLWKLTPAEIRGVLKKVREAMGLE